MELTALDILEDIRGFEARISLARDKLAASPATARTLQTRQNLKEKRRILNSEIEHVKRLIGIAEEALTDA